MDMWKAYRQTVPDKLPHAKGETITNEQAN